MRRLHRYLKIWLAAALTVSLVSGCGEKTVGESYPLESVTQNGPQVSRVYRAENKTVPQVAQELAAQRKPQEMSKEDPERMFLVYPDEWYHLQRDPQKPDDTLIEVDSKEFVRENYNPGFLEGYILGSVLDDLFDSRRHYPGQYRGYTSREVYKPFVDYRTPTPEEKKTAPPVTKPGSGSIIRRSDKPAASGGSDGSATDGPTSNAPGTSVGSGGSVIKKGSPVGDGKWQDSGTPPATGGGTVNRPSGGSSGSSLVDRQPKSGSQKFSPPKNNSPPRTKVGSSGSVIRRK